MPETLPINDILIVGTGALATYYAARLSRAGLRVHMLGSWEAGLSSLQKQGARILDEDDIERAYPVHATSDARECRGAKFALILVKAWQTERAARQLKDCLAEDGMAVSLQNGLGNRETLTRDLGPGRVGIGVTTTGATLLGPGLVRGGGEGVVSLERNQAFGPLKEALRLAKFSMQDSEEVESLVWGKLVINAAINPLTALLQVPNGELLERSAARSLMIELAVETAAVAAAEKIRLPFDDPAQAVEAIARQTASNYSSMLQDLRRGAHTEVDAINGAVVQHGNKRGVSVPVNQIFWQLVLAKSGSA